MQTAGAVERSAGYDHVLAQEVTEFQQLVVTKDEIMAGPSSRRTRTVRWGLATCGWLIVLVALYVASVGPMVWLESHGHGSSGTWKRLHRTVYRPVFDAWWFGPRWISSSLGWYLRKFEGSFDWRSAPRYFSIRYNDMGRVARIRHQVFNSVNVAQAELNEWRDTKVVFFLGESERDQFLIEHASKEFE